MVGSITQLSIMLASPSDMITDRESVASAVDESNQLLASRLIQFKLLGWEKDVSPGVGEYAQAVVNEQLFDKYDIMIALFGSRLGTATPHSPSGTAEEVRHALSKSDSPDKLHRLLTFFKRVNVSALDCDIEQIQKLQEFRKELQASNVFYKEYDTSEQLTRQVRYALNQIAERLNNTDSIEVVKAPLPDILKNEPSNDEMGLLDLVQLSDTHIENATQNLSSASDMLVTIAELANHYTKLFTENNAALLSNKEKRALINEFSVALDNNASKLRNSILIARSSFNVALDSLLSAINIQLMDVDDQGFSSEAVIPQLSLMINSASTSQSQMAELRDSIEGLPRLTSQLNAAKRTTLNAIDQFDLLVQDLNNRVASISVRLTGTTKLN